MRDCAGGVCPAHARGNAADTVRRTARLPAHHDHHPRTPVLERAQQKRPDNAPSTAVPLTMPRVPALPTPLSSSPCLGAHNSKYSVSWDRNSSLYHFTKTRGPVSTDYVSFNMYATFVLPLVAAPSVTMYRTLSVLLSAVICTPSFVRDLCAAGYIYIYIGIPLTRLHGIGFSYHTCSSIQIS